jgi:hypothetical protein
VAEYKLSKIIPENLKSVLPTIEEIEDNLKEIALFGKKIIINT